MDMLKKAWAAVSPSIKISESAKQAVANIKNDFQKSFKVIPPDLDIDTHPDDSSVIVTQVSAGLQGKLPFAGGIVIGLHAAHIGELEGNENPPAPIDPPNNSDN